MIQDRRLAKLWDGVSGGYLVSFKTNPLVISNQRSITNHAMTIETLRLISKDSGPYRYISFLSRYLYNYADTSAGQDE